MPSASSAKIEKQQTSNSNMENADNSSPIRQVLITIEHKIRNLEKRKGKLESYRDIEKSGKELSSDQKTAVSKYNEVAQTLEFAREFCKQIIQISAISEKELKKKQKKDEMLKKQTETSRTREILVMQNILRLILEEATRECFLNGTNGACKLEESDFELLDKFSEEICPKRPSALNEIPFNHAVQKSADHLAFVIDNKSKPFGNGTYSDLKTIFRNVQKCGYFDRASLPPVEEPVALEDEPKESVDEVNDTIGQESTDQDVIEVVECKENTLEFQEAPAATAVPVPTFPPQQIVSVQTSPMVQPIPIVPPIVPVVGITNVSASTVAIPAPSQIHPPHMQPTTVRAVEQAYFKQHQYMQQMRPLAEVIGTGNFFFLQDSELDSPDVPAFPPPPSNAQISPTAQPTNNQQQIVSQKQPQPSQVPQVSQQPPQQSQQHQQPQQQQPLGLTPVLSANAPISSQTFTNQTYTNIPPPQIFPNIKPTDVSQPHIPGFATPNAPIPIPLVQQSSMVQQQQQPIAQQPLIANQPPQTQIHTGPSSTMIAPFTPSAGKLNTPTISHDPVSQKPSSTPNDTKHLPASNDLKTNRAVETEKRVPEITEWKAEDATKVVHEEITEWRDPYETTEVTDWNEDAQEESNTWSNNHRYNYRGHQNNYSGRNGRNGPPNRTGNNAANGYRARPGNAYNPNGRQSGNASGSTFYRNNENYYHNQNGSSTNGSGAGVGNYRGNGDSTKESGFRVDGKDGGTGGGYRNDKSENTFRSEKDGVNFRDNKYDGGFRSGHFKSRENNGLMRGAGNRSGNRHNSNSAERVNRESGAQQRNIGPQPNATNNRSPSLGNSGGGGNGGANNANNAANGNGNGNGSNQRPSNKGQMFGSNSRVTTTRNETRTQNSGINA